MSFFCCGVVCVDHVWCCEAFPAAGTTALVSSISPPSGGGGACNVSVNLLCLSERKARVVPVCALGDDSNGEFLKGQLAGADLSRVVVTSGEGAAATSATIVISEADRTFLHFPGGNAVLTTEHVVAGIQGCGPGDVVYLAYPLLVPRVDFAKVAAGACGATVALDVSLPAPHRIAEWRKIVTDAAPHLDLLFCNEHEALALLGERAGAGGPLSWLGLVNLAHSLSAFLSPFSFRGAVIVHSSVGAALASDHKKSLRFHPAFRVPAERIRGTNGAGDAFSAGFLLALCALGLPEQEALGTGCAVAAACLTHPTPSGGVRSLAECRSLADSFGPQGLDPHPQDLGQLSLQAAVPALGAILRLWRQRARGGQDARRLVVGLTGAGGAGKTTLAAQLAWAINILLPQVANPVALSTDGFHRTNEELRAMGLSSLKGRRDTFDIDRLCSQAARLKTDATVPWPVYDRTIRDPRDGALTVPAECALVIVEGLWARDCQCDLIIHLRGTQELLKSRMQERKLASGREWDEAHYKRVDEQNFNLLNDTFDPASGDCVIDVR
jgi:sugar/nucleoside kinase (ribokinase family)/pantothenate kinase